MAAWGTQLLPTPLLTHPLVQLSPAACRARVPRGRPRPPASHLPHPGAEGPLPGLSLLQVEVGIEEHQVHVALQVLQAPELQPPGLWLRLGRFGLEDGTGWESDALRVAYSCPLMRPPPSAPAPEQEEGIQPARAKGTALVTAETNMARLSHRGSDCGCSTASIPMFPHPRGPGSVATSCSQAGECIVAWEGDRLLASDPNWSLTDFPAHSSSGSGSGAGGGEYSLWPWPHLPQGQDRSQKGHQGSGSTRDTAAEGRKSRVHAGRRDINQFNEPS